VKTLLSRLDFSYIYVFLGEATLGLTFLFYIILARILGPELYEVFASAVALGAILSLFIQFGLPTLLTREVAANPHEAPKNTIQFLLLEGLTFLPILLLLLPIARMLNYEGEGLVVCYLVILAEFCRSAKMTVRGVLRGMGWFRAETVSVTLERFFAVLFAGAVLLLSRNLIWVVATFVLVRSLDVLGLLFYLRRKTRIWSAFSLTRCGQTFRQAYPFALSGVLWIIYYQVDIVMLKAIAPAGEAGFYSASYRVMEIFSTLPRVIFQVTLTKFTQCYAVEPNRIPEEIYKTARLLLIAVLPVLIAASLLQANLVHIVYGDAYDRSAQSLAILLPSISVQMFSSMAHQVLQAAGREKTLPPILLITVTINIALNSVLIPYLGSVGAALATLFSELLLCITSLQIMSCEGYKQLSRCIQLIAALSCLALILPFLMLNGLTPAIAVGLMFFSIAAIILLMRRDRFFDLTR
jgi:O-antigen/teichoic acid export membrane protein